MNINNENQSAEKISAYLDDALAADELESLLGAPASVVQADGRFSLMARYHLMGDALRGELSDASMVDVSVRIQQALLNQTFDEIEVTKPVKKAGLNNRFDFSAWLGSFSRPLAGMALAASVAALMVVTVVQFESPEAGQPLAASPVNLPADTLVASKPVDEAVAKESQLTEFDNYLTEHAEFAAQDTLQGRLPYVRAVSYQAE